MRLTKVDQLILANAGHSYLNIDDNCYFFGEYTVRENWSFSDVNQLILNFKKIRIRCRSEYEVRHKDRAIETAATLWAGEFGKTDETLAGIKSVTLVPTPPSKAPNDPEYDDRIIRMLNLLSQKLGGLDVRELVLQAETYTASHTSNDRLSPDELANKYTINEDLAFPEPQSILIFDDTLISGSHYKAMVKTLSNRFPEAHYFGMFLARGVFQN